MMKLKPLVFPLTTTRGTRSARRLPVLLAVVALLGTSGCGQLSSFAPAYEPDDVDHLHTNAMGIKESIATARKQIAALQQEAQSDPGAFMANGAERLSTIGESLGSLPDKAIKMVSSGQALITKAPTQYVGPQALHLPKKLELLKGAVGALSEVPDEVVALVKCIAALTKGESCEAAALEAPAESVVADSGGAGASSSSGGSSGGSSVESSEGPSGESSGESSGGSSEGAVAASLGGSSGEPSGTAGGRGAGQPDAPEGTDSAQATAQASPSSASLAADSDQRLFGMPAMDPATFNRIAVLVNQRVHWRTDTLNPGVLDPSELTVPGSSSISTPWVKNGEFHPKFKKVYKLMVEARRKEVVAQELNQGRSVVLQTDARALTEEDRLILAELMVVAELTDNLYRLQRGEQQIRGEISRDSASRALYERNQSVGCIAPKTESDPFCSASSSFTSPMSEAYPSDMKHDQEMCDLLRSQPNATSLLDPFTVVRRVKDGEGFIAIPYHLHYANLTGAIAKRLRKASDVILSEAEQPLKKYLAAAAKGFETNAWWEADEAWSEMSGSSSKWYLRVGPDETYMDPCQVKAGFHLSLALIDKGAVEWQKRLTGLRQEMEQRIADVIGAPYAARDVKFHMPEFIQVVLNAGDARSGLGATVGQSLPNFGPVAAESRGRTVMMANLYQDPTSIQNGRLVADSLFSKEAMAFWSDKPTHSQLDIILHEATHNFGPTGTWRVEGKLPEEVFGGRTDAILEELKAQTGSLFYLDYLRERGDLDEETAKGVTLSALRWSMGQVARGLWTSTGKPKTYGQVAAIQLHWFVSAGAIRFDETSSGSGEPGRFVVDFDALRGSVEALMRHVGRIKAAGDKAAAEQMIQDCVKDSALAGYRSDLVTSRTQRFPSASFIYEIIMP